MNKDNYIHTPYNDEWIAQRADPYVYRHTDGTCYFTASVPAYDRVIRGRRRIWTAWQMPKKKHSG